MASWACMSTTHGYGMPTRLQRPWPANTRAAAALMSATHNGISGMLRRTHRCALWFNTPTAAAPRWLCTANPYSMAHPRL